MISISTNCNDASANYQFLSNYYIYMFVRNLTSQMITLNKPVKKSIHVEDMQKRQFVWRINFRRTYKFMFGNCAQYKTHIILAERLDGYNYNYLYYRNYLVYQVDKCFTIEFVCIMLHVLTRVSHMREIDIDGLNRLIYLELWCANTACWMERDTSFM